MINIPEEVKELLKADGTRKNFRVHFPNGEREDITKENIVEEQVTFTESISSQGFKFGLCETPMIEFETFGIENIKGKTIECFLDVETDQGVYSISYGTFTVSSSRIENLVLNQRKIIAYANDLSGFPLGKTEETKEKFQASANVPYTVNVQKTVLSMYSFEKQEGTYTDLAFKSNEDGNLFNVSFGRESSWIGWNEYGMRCLVYELNNVTKAQALYWAEYEDALGDIDAITSELWLPVEVKEQMRDMLRPFVAMGISLVSGGALLTQTKSFIPSVSNYIYPFLSLDSSQNAVLYGGSNVSSYICIPIEVYSIRYTSGYYDTQTATIRSTNNAKLQSVNLSKEFTINTSISRSKYSYTAPFPSIDGGDVTIECYLVKDSDMLKADDIISGYFELAGELIKTSRDGKILATNLGAENLELTTGDIIEAWVDDAGTKPYGRIYCEYTNTNGATANFYHYIIPKSEWNSEHYQTYSISSNTLIKNNRFTSTALHTAVEALAEALADITYMPLEVKAIGCPYAEAGDGIIIHTPNGDMKSFILSRTLSGIDMLFDEFVADADENDVDYTKIQAKNEASVDVEEQITALQNSKMDVNAVSAVQKYKQGTEIASIIVNGTETKLFAPSGGGGGGVSPVVLWENPSPSASFAAQTITLSDNAENYDYIGVIFAGGSNSADNRRRFAPLILVPTNAAIGGGASITGYRNYRRNFTAAGDKMTFEDGGYYATYGTNTMTTSNQYVIPRQVLGFKL